MADENILGESQAVNQFVQQQTKHIEGQPVRVYPFKIVSGLSYFTNRGQKPLGSNPGNTSVATDNTAKNNDYGAYTGVTTMYSGAHPLICYWFGVVNVQVGDNGLGQPASNQTTEYLNVKWVNPAPLTNGGTIPADSLFTPKQFQNPFENNQLQYPWKELGLMGYSVSSGKDQQAETLDNLKIACYETSYDYTMYSTDWVPNFQQINEFVYFIVDVRCACPIALRITSVEPHYDTVGILQDCTINFSSINQYYNNNGRNVLTYVKFGAVGDDYAFPEEIWYDDPNDPTGTPQFMTVLNKQLFMNSMGGVNQIEVKNNALTGQFGALVYGHPYQPFMMVYGEDGTISVQKTWYADDYLIPWRFTAPCQDIIDVASETVHSTYDLAMNMLIINEQIWGNWKSTKEFYNLTQNFTFQGGLAFDDPEMSKQQVTDQSTGNSVTQFISTLFGTERNVYQQVFGTQNYDTWSGNAPGMQNLGRFTKGYGSKNIANVILSNANGSSLANLSDPNNIWYLTRDPNTAIHGFALPPSAVIDFRGTGFTSASWMPLATFYSGSNIGWIWTAMRTLGYIGTGLEFAQKTIDLYYNSQFQPSNLTDSEIYSLDNYPASGFKSITPEKFFALNSWSMINVHQLEINYRDGIVYTNQNQGHGGVMNEIENMVGSITDAFGGYTPGYSNFFTNTYARTYNLLLPHMITMLAEQYINPTNAVYNAIPLDIFANTNQNNTSVGQLKYLSGYQYILTNWFTSSKTGGRVETTCQMRYADLGQNSDGSNVTRYINPQDTTNAPVKDMQVISRGDIPVPIKTNGKIGVAQIPYNSVVYFKEPAEPLTSNQPGHTSYVIDSINVKQLGISNVHITYWKEVPTDQALANAVNGQAYSETKLQSVGEEWIENTAKMMNNTSYIDNSISYDVYDEINTKKVDNCEPYLAFQFPADPMVSLSLQQLAENEIGDSSVGMHFIALSSNAPVKGVNFTNQMNNVGIAKTIGGAEFGQFNLVTLPTMKSGNGTCYYCPLSLTGSYQSGFGPGYEAYKTTWSTAAGANWYADYLTSFSNSKSGSTVYTGVYWPQSTSDYPLDITISSSYNFNNGNMCPQFSANTVNWWQNECTACGTTISKDLYYPGRLDYFGVITVIGAVQVSNGWNASNSYAVSGANLSNATNEWLGNVILPYPNKPNTGPHANAYSCGFLGTYDGIMQPYSFECVYYAFDYVDLINEVSNYWESAVPSNATIGSNESINWNYVLIPHGANPKEYMNSYAYQTADANTYPWINSQEAVILIEPGNNASTNTHNNVVFYNGNYNGQYTPNNTVSMQWYNGVPSSANTTSNGNNFCGVYGCTDSGFDDVGYSTPMQNQPNISYGFNVFTSYEAINSALGSWNGNAQTQPIWWYNIWSHSTFPVTPCTAQLPFQQLGMGASYVYQKTNPGMKWNDETHFFVGNSTNGWVGDYNIDGANPFVWPQWQYNQPDGNTGDTVVVGTSAYALAKFNNNSMGQGWSDGVAVPLPIVPGANNWPHMMWAGMLLPGSESDIATAPSPTQTWQDGEYDLYIFYSIYQN